MSDFDTRIESWAAEFADSPEARAFPGRIRESSQDLLAEFLGGACQDGCDPTQVGEAEVRAGLLDRVGGMSLAKDVREAAPRLVGAYLEMLGREGRVADGRRLAALARALDGAFRKGAKGSKGTPEVRVAPKLGLNDPWGSFG